MIRKEREGVKWLEFELLAEFPQVVHGVFLRAGGYSEGAFASLNVGGGTGDSPVAIQKNREKLRALTGASRLISGMQVHGAHVTYLSAGEEPGECDGFVTQEKGIGLMIKHADCQVAILYDPVQHALATVHCGWRGNVHNIYLNAIDLMKKKVGVRPENLLVCVSPSLGPNKAEFIHYKKELPESFWPFQVTPTYFDLWEISRAQLREAGVLPRHIEIAGLCTYENCEDFFSYRRDKVTGRHATIALLK